MSGGWVQGELRQSETSCDWTDSTEQTIARDIARWEETSECFSRYIDEQWEGSMTGEHGMQPSIR
jgi:hypothetical protein